MGSWPEGLKSNMVELWLSGFEGAEADEASTDIARNMYARKKGAEKVINVETIYRESAVTQVPGVKRNMIRIVHRTLN